MEISLQWQALTSTTNLSPIVAHLVQRGLGPCRRVSLLPRSHFAPNSPRQRVSLTPVSFWIHVGFPCYPLDQTQGNYSTNILTTRAIDIVNKHDTSEPLFLYLAYQGVHGPRQAPEYYWGRYNSTIEDMDRRIFAGMVTAVDEGNEACYGGCGPM
jgi:hypothetical protein